MAVFNITTGTDDGVWTTTGGIYSNSGASITVGLSSSKDYCGFWRFNNITIPNSATITSAIFTAPSYASNASTEVELKCHFVNEDNAATIESDTDANSRSLTTGIDWDITEAWTNLTTYNSPELKTSLQTVIDRPGWVSGNSICFVLVNDGGVGSKRIYAYEYTGNTAYGYLTVTWEGGGEPPAATFIPRIMMY